MLGFWVGQLLRDFRWYHTLSRQWPSTAEFIDWEYVEKLREENEEGSAEPGAAMSTDEQRR